MGIINSIRFNDMALGRFEIRETDNYTIISVGHRDLFFLKDGTFDGTATCLVEAECPVHLPITNAEDPPYRI